MSPSDKDIESVKKAYPVDTRVELVKMDDPQAPPIGTKGTVDHIDDIGTVFCKWDNGSGLGFVPGEDVVKKLDSVVVITYGQKQIWDSRAEAIKFYLDAMVSCEGAERDRYTNIYCDLIAGLPICRDEVEDE